MTKNLKYKLGSIDLDGTLLSKKLKKVTKKDCLSIQKALADGYYMGINTGRPYYSAKMYVNEINSYGAKNVSFLSCYNGAYIVDFVHNKTYTKIIDKDIAKQIYDYAKTISGVKYWFYTVKGFSNGNVNANQKFLKSLIAKWKMAKLIPIGNVNDLASYKINLFSLKQKTINLMYEYLKKSNLANLVSFCKTNRHLIEITPLNIDKGYALNLLSKIYNISNNEIVSFGDSFNDKKAFDVSGFNVGIKPANKKLYQYCDMIVYFKKSAMSYAINNVFYNFIESNKNIKVIFSDLDGTIIDSKTKKFTNDTKIALQECVKNNIRLIIASGRGIQDILNFTKDLELPNSNDYYIVANNGATIYNPNKNVYLHNETINELDGKNLFNYFIAFNKMSGNKCGLIIHQKEPQLLFNNEPFWKKINLKKTGNENVYDQWVKSKPVYITDYPSNLVCYKMLIKFPSHEDAINGLKIFTKQFPQFKIVLSSDVNMEINKKGIDKGFALKYFSKLLNIPTNNFLIMGDSQNDIDALKLSNYSFCPSFAKNNVQKACTHILDENKNISFVANVIYKFVLFKTKYVMAKMANNENK